MTMRPVLCLVVAALALGGCSDGESDPPAAVPPTSTSPATSTSPLPESTPEPTAEASCQDREHVPGTSIIHTRSGRTVLLASIPFRLAKGGIASTSSGVQPGAVVIGTTVTSGNGPLAPADERSILQSMGGPASASEVEDVELSIPVDQAKEPGAYVAYRTAVRAYGKFRVEACGSPYNDGTAVEVVRGSYQTLQQVAPARVVRCDAEPGRPGEEAAQKAGCGG